MVVVGNLLNQPSKFDLFDIFLKDKKIRGLFLYKWLPSLTEEERYKAFDLISKDLNSGGKIFGSKIVKTIPIKDWKKGLEEFR